MTTGIMTRTGRLALTIALAGILAAVTGGPAAAERILLKGGKTMTVTNVRSDGDRIWFTWKGLTASIAKRDVIRIEDRGLYRKEEAPTTPPPVGTADHAQTREAVKTPAAAPAATNARVGQTQPPRPRPVLDRHLPSAAIGLPEKQPEDRPQPGGGIQLTELLSPGGFGDMRWGDRLYRHPTLRRLQEDSEMPGVQEYARPDDSLQLGTDPRGGIIKYAFWENQLYAVTLWAAGPDAYAAIRTAMFERFGPGMQSASGSRTFYWTDQDADRMIDYLDEDRLGMLWMRSREVNHRYKIARLRIPIKAGHAPPADAGSTAVQRQ